jgi:hypothetical protein
LDLVYIVEGALPPCILGHGFKEVEEAEYSAGIQRKAISIRPLKHYKKAIYKAPAHQK